MARRHCRLSSFSKQGRENTTYSTCSHVSKHRTELRDDSLVINEIIRAERGDAVLPSATNTLKESLAFGPVSQPEREISVLINTTVEWENQFSWCRMNLCAARCEFCLVCSDFNQVFLCVNTEWKTRLNLNKHETFRLNFRNKQL